MFILKRRNKITTLDLCIFFRQFATLLRAGIPLIQSCHILESNQQNPKLNVLIYTIKCHLLSGKTLFQAMEHQQMYFDALSTQLIHIGEQTGRLDTMLDNIAIHKERNYIFLQRIRQALIYPAFILVCALLLTGSMFFFIVPRFASLFADAKIKLPLLTTCIFSIAEFLTHYAIYFLLIAFLTSIYLYYSYPLYYQKHCKQFLSKQIVIQKIILARFARNLACTFEAGISIPDSILLIANTHKELDFTNLLYQLRNELHAGMSLHAAMGLHPYFPSYMLQMVKVGEESGHLDLMLTKTADLYEAEVDRFITQSSQLLEPLIMLMLGVLIGGLVIALYLPIFNLGSTL